MVNVLSLLVLLQCAAAGDDRSLFKGATDVTVLHPVDFEVTVLKDARAWVVDFYADWCGHCIRFAPVYKAMAAKLAGEPRVRFGAMNCAVHSDFCGGIGVHGYPTVRVFHFPGYTSSGGTEKGGENVERKDVRSVDKIALWINSHLPAGWVPAGLEPSVESGVASSAAAPPQLTNAPPALQKSLAAAAPQLTNSSLEASHETPANAAASSTAVIAEELGQQSSGQPGAAIEGASTTALAAELAALQEVKEKPVAFQHLWDAEVAFLVSLRHGTFLQASMPNNATGGPSVLDGPALAELCRWLDFVAGMLPTEGARRDAGRVAAAACEAERARGRLDHDEWTHMLEGLGIDAVPSQAGVEESGYWALCKTYTCGLWSLFHLLTLAAGDSKIRHGPGFLASSSSSSSSSADAASASVSPEDATGRSKHHKLSVLVGPVVATRRRSHGSVGLSLSSSDARLVRSSFCRHSTVASWAVVHWHPATEWDQLCGCGRSTTM